ncbi:unnamed protein product, partial [Ascophyllum nodosum]
IGGVKDGFESSATGGHVFTMEIVRKYKGHRLDPKSLPDSFARPDEESMCEHWAVLTSIFDPTETVRQLGEMAGWCVVVVGDKNGPTEYDASGVTYLTPDDQDALPYRIANILPWNHFGRKNVGYLYAVHHGAKVIYDVDDDNALIWPEEAIPHAEATEENKLLLFRGDESAVVHNPYPCFGGPGNVWPRGFPLNAINEESSVPCGVIAEKKYRHKRREAPRPLGVLQSLANHDPDVDAIYRLTYPEGCLPFNFEDSPSSAGESPPRVVPDHSMTPYNAQATLHFPEAFWGMLLPVTVHGRVSDIWRSYFTQALLPSVGAVVAFAPAWVEQVRNVHDYLADFQAELPLYQRSGALVAFLLEYRSQLDEIDPSDGRFTSIMERVEALAITMYEYGILEEVDVELTQAWLQDLWAVGY